MTSPKQKKSKEKIKVAIVDDHAVMRLGIRCALSCEADIEIVGEYDGGNGAAAWIAAREPDVVLLDIRMPDKDGVTVLTEILLIRPQMRVVMLTTSAADEDVYRSLKQGAKGYILKDRGCDDLYKAVRTVAGGGTYVPDDIREIFRQRQMMPDLTVRELDVLRLMCEGLNNDAIAANMGVSYDCVKVHLSHIFSKLQVEGRVEAMAKAIRMGLVETPSNLQDNGK